MYRVLEIGVIRRGQWLNVSVSGPGSCSFFSCFLLIFRPPILCSRWIIDLITNRSLTFDFAFFLFDSKTPLNNVYLCRFEAEVQGSIKAIFARAEAILRSLNICNCASFGFYVMHPCLFFLPAPSFVFQDTKATAITLGAGVFSPLAPLLNVV